jgi:hypothetical protein
MKKLIMISIVMLMTVSANAALVDFNDSNEQGQYQGQQQGQAQGQGQQQGQVSVAAQGQLQGMDNSGNQDTTINSTYEQERYVNVPAAPLPATQGLTSIVAATPFGSAGVSTETIIAKCQAYGAAIINGIEYGVVSIEDGRKMYADNLDKMEKLSKPNKGYITKLLRILF